MGGRRVDYRILGPLEVVGVDGNPMRLGGPKPRLLLALLLLHRNEVRSVDRLVDDLWGDAPPASAATMLHGYISKLRKTLADGGAPDVLVRRPPGYVLLVEPEALDAARFDQLVDGGSRAAAGGASVEAAEILRRALSLWRGPALSDLAFEPAVHEDARRLEAAQLAAIERRVEAELAAGRNGDLVPELESLCARHPFEERLHAQLMLALYRAGRAADALSVYEVLRRRLAHELGLDPSGELRELESTIIRRDRAPGPPPAKVNGTVDDAPPRRVPSRWLVAVGAAVAVVGASAAAIAVVAHRDGADAARSVTVRPASVAVIDPVSRRVLADVAVGEAPSAAISDGRSVWVASVIDRTVSIIDARNPRIATTRGIPAAPTSIVAAFGSIWIGTSWPTLLRLDQRYGTLEKAIRVGRQGAGPTALASSAQLILFAQRGSPLRAVDPRTGRVIRVYHVQPNGDAIAVAYGSAWFGAAGLSRLVRVKTSTGAVHAVPVVHALRAVAVGFGSVWAVLAGDHRVWRFDPDSLAVQDTIPVRGDPRALAIDPDNRSVWVADGAIGGVIRIDAETNKAVDTIRTRGVATGVTVAAGRLWVSVAGRETSDGAIRRLRPVASIPTGEDLGVTAGAGSIWVTERREGRLLRIDPQKNRIVARIWIGPAKEPVYGIGAVWVPADGIHSLLRIDPRRNAAVKWMKGPYNEAAVGAGAIWALTWRNGATNRVDRVDARTKRVLATVRGVPENAYAIAFGGGSVWVCGGDLDQPLTPGWIWRIDPATARVVARVQLPRICRGMAYGFGSLWAALYGSELYRIDPAHDAIAAHVRTSQGGTFFQDYIAIGTHSVWVTNLNNATDAELVEVDPRSMRVRAHASLAQGATGVVSAFGSVWVSHFVGARVLRFTGV